MINSMKIELENIARNSMKILEAGAVYLKANTRDIKKTKESSGDFADQTNLFGLFSGEMSDLAPDERVMEFLGSTAIHTDSDLDGNPEVDLPADQPDVEADQSPGDDWF